MTPALQLIAETQADPIWLRTLATVLPVVGTIVVGVVAAPWLVDKLRTKRNPENPELPALSSTQSSLPAPVSVAATERAQADPIIRLFIEDLHERLSQAHEEVAQMHLNRASDAATIARLTAELAEREERLGEVERALTDKSAQANALRGRLSELRQELELTQRRLQICTEGYNQ